MAPKRFSIYNSPTLDRVLGERIQPQSPDDDQSGRSRSSLISAIADRYAEIVRRSQPELTVPEWCLIFDVLNGCWSMDNPALAAQGIAHQIADASDLDGIGKKWGVDGKDLARRVSSVPFATQIAILDTAERFWSLGCTEGESWADVVSRLVPSKPKPVAKTWG